MTAACPVPRANSRAASKRRASNAATSRRPWRVLAMPQHGIVPDDDHQSISRESLVAGVWSADYPRAMRVARRIRAGTVWIWDNYAQPVEGIWGGYKQSGMGRELGYHGLNDFIEVKQIFTDGTGLSMKAPYSQVIKE